MMSGHRIRMAAAASPVPRAFYAPLGTVLSLAVFAVSLSPFADSFLVRVLIYWAATSLAYGLMPYVRRGDIPLVAAWVVLLSELAPCVSGELISPMKVTADVLGVMMAAVPIYVARLRQVQQGDTRGRGRRASDSCG